MQSERARCGRRFSCLVPPEGRRRVARVCLPCTCDVLYGHCALAVSCCRSAPPIVRFGAGRVAAALYYGGMKPGHARLDKLTRAHKSYSEWRFIRLG